MEPTPPVAVRVCVPEYRFRSLATGQVVPAWCGGWRCLRCGPKKARRVMAAAHGLGLERFVTLTLVGNEWQQIRNRVKRLVGELAELRHRVSLVWTVEANPAGTGHHAHGLSGGDWVHVDVWRRCADAVGLGRRVRVERAHTTGAGHYAVKAGLYSVKGCAGGPEEYGSWLRLNGFRAVHWTRRAFAGMSWAEAWPAFLASRGWESSDPGPWVREPISDRGDLLADAAVLLRPGSLPSEL